MIKKILDLMRKHKQIITYVIVGGCTTVVSLVVFFLPGISSLAVEVRNTISWTAAVLFAFFANRFFVFTESTKDKHLTFREFGEFVLSRVFSHVVETTFLRLGLIIGIDPSYSKIPVSVIVIVLNYITGKLVFRGKKD